MLLLRNKMLLLRNKMPLLRNKTPLLGSKMSLLRNKTHPAMANTTGSGHYPRVGGIYSSL